MWSGLAAEDEEMHETGSQPQPALARDFLHMLFGEDLAGRAIDQPVEIGKPAQRFLRDGKSEGAVIAAFDRAQHRQGSLIERIAPAQHGIEQAQRGAAGGHAGKIIGLGGRTSHW